ncbi:hypothetical protein CPU12_01010 [Malaciobacter molluscorum LMG 25693]|uniref:Probable membrane transporter protein n=1 Tax=Malaciobacter molluscorum LMG 25693 TaxID=870501 RepID=A0A2G1DLK3_9BACT|nr:sulfite exporter TauE/SafE family protein [Malaciobacter molluscorum]AXX92159.1 sulfite exporter TauE/SafE family protein [Malaciobacter molluscorum LMG 25693]PHO19388.1 hypothetical protein CPU12_01010 [Malaciobacter molluscorum LMG 25693]
MDFFTLPINNLDLIILIISCFLGSLITTSVGAGGGLFVIAGMSMVLPAATLLSIHALTQAGAGLVRSFIFRKYIIFKVFLLFLIGTLIGYSLSIHFLITLPEYKMKFILGLGIIILNFLPTFQIKKVTNVMIIFVGVITGFLTMFIGAMGPIVILFLGSFIKNRQYIVGTLAWCISFQNLGKSIIFGNLGFDYSAWIFLIIILILVSYLGTIIGKKLLDKSNDILFRKILKVVILILGSKLIFDSINIYLSL